MRAIVPSLFNCCSCLEKNPRAQLLFYLEKAYLEKKKRRKQMIYFKSLKMSQHLSVSRCQALIREQKGDLKGAEDIKDYLEEVDLRILRSLRGQLKLCLSSI